MTDAIAPQRNANWRETPSMPCRPGCYRKDGDVARLSAVIAVDLLSR